MYPQLGLSAKGIRLTLFERQCKDVMPRRTSSPFAAEFGQRPLRTLSRFAHENTPDDRFVLRRILPDHHAGAAGSSDSAKLEDS
jgi:hypothetical protein